MIKSHMWRYLGNLRNLKFTLLLKIWPLKWEFLAIKFFLRMISKKAKSKLFSYKKATHFEWGLSHYIWSWDSPSSFIWRNLLKELIFIVFTDIKMSISCVVLIVWKLKNSEHIVKIFLHKDWDKYNMKGNLKQLAT